MNMYPSSVVLEEDILYTIYDLPFLKKYISNIRSLTVELNTQQPNIQINSFRLVIETIAPTHSLQLDLPLTSSFIEKLTAVKRLEVEASDWTFLDESIQEVKDALPQLLNRLESLIADYCLSRFRHEFQLPQSLTIQFKAEDEQLFYEETPTRNTRIRAWERFILLHQTHLSYLGFTPSKLDSLRSMKILKFAQHERTFSQHNVVTEFALSVTFAEVAHTFNWLEYKQPVDFRLHIYVDSDFYCDKETEWLVATGIDLGTFFSISKDNGFEFEKLLLTFLKRTPALRIW